MRYHPSVGAIFSGRQVARTVGQLRDQH